MKVEINQERLAKLSTMWVSADGHSSYESGTCIMELAAWLRGLPITDTLECVSGPIQVFLRHYNDRIPYGPRQALRDLAPKILGSVASREIEQKRAFIAADYAVRVFAPFWLERASRKKDAAKLRAVAPIVDNETAEAGKSAASTVYATSIASVVHTTSASDALAGVAHAITSAAYVASGAAYTTVAAYAAFVATATFPAFGASATSAASAASDLQPQVFKMLDKMLEMKDE